MRSAPLLALALLSVAEPAHAQTWQSVADTTVVPYDDPGPRTALGVATFTLDLYATPTVSRTVPLVGLELSKRTTAGRRDAFSATVTVAGGSDVLLLLSDDARTSKVTLDLDLGAGHPTTVVFPYYALSNIRYEAPSTVAFDVDFSAVFISADESPVGGSLDTPDAATCPQTPAWQLVLPGDDLPLDGRYPIDALVLDGTVSDGELAAVIDTTGPVEPVAHCMIASLLDGGYMPGVEFRLGTDDAVWLDAFVTRVVLEERDGVWIARYRLAAEGVY